MHAQTEVDLLRTRMVPMAEKALDFTRRGFDAGRFAYPSLAKAQNDLFDLRHRPVASLTRYHLLFVEVERLTAVAEDEIP